MSRMEKLTSITLVNLFALLLASLVFITIHAVAGSTGQLDVLCVNPGGTGGCYASIQDAIDAATDGSTIQVAAGDYTETVVLTKSLTLQGGWNAGFTARDWDAYPTTIDAQGNGPTIWVNAPVTPTIEGFIITGGDDTDYLGWGGGVKLYWSGHVELEGLTTIRHNVITNNVACNTDLCQGHGGGIMVYRTTAIIESNTIVSNAARIGGTHGGQGGGVRVWTAKATLVGNIILSNTAVFSTTSLCSGQGGGVCTQYAREVTLEDNEIRGNVAAVKGTGRGGGVYGYFAYLYGNQILSNTASISGTGYGGGIYADYVTDFNDNLVQGNVASISGDGSGGGIFASYLADARRNTIEGNVATRGGGVYMKEYSGEETLRDNLIIRNQATGSDDTVPDGGGGIASAADHVEIIGNEILSNTTSGAGGGVLFSAGTRYVLQDSRIENNTAMAGGGVAVYTATGAIAHNQVISNLALFGGGMFLWGAASPALDSNVVLNNTAYGFINPGGGGLLVNVDPGTAVTLTNHIIARNAAGPGGPGGGIVCWQGDCNLINNSIVDNNLGDYKEGVILASSGPHTLTNNIIAGHSIGVWAYGGASATLSHNDYWDNVTHTQGIGLGSWPYQLDPSFQDRAGGDYHLTLTSSLIDQGDSSVAPDHDFEGDPRPRGGGIDIGADEAYPDQVYVSINVGSDITGTGTPTEPFATVTQALGETRTGGAIYVARGHYTERITVTRSVNLMGGYHEDGWSRDIAAYTTTLDAQGSGTVVVIQGAGVQTTLEGFTITGGEAHMYGPRRWCSGPRRRRGYHPLQHHHWQPRPERRRGSGRLEQ